MTNLTWHPGKIQKSDREKLAMHKGLIVWLYGLSGAGKSTLAVETENQLISQKIHTYRLDGDNIRIGLNKDLGFSQQDRTENIRRITEVAKLFLDCGIVTFVSFITPTEKLRNIFRQNIPTEDILEVFIDVSLESAMKRDTKGLYKKALKGEIKNFTGVSAPFEVPPKKVYSLNTDKHSVEDCANELYKKILGMIKN